MASDATTGAGGPRLTALPGARAALALLLIINLFNYIDRQVLAALLKPIHKDFFPETLVEGQSELEANKLVQAKLGILNTAFMVSYMVLAPLFGWLADRRGRWHLIGIGVILWSLASGASGLATSFAMLFITRCFVGVGEAAYGPAAPAIISDLYPVKIRGRIMAWFYAAIPVGSALGYVLGGFMHGLTDDWRWAFYVVLPPGILLGIWCFFMPDPPRGQADLSDRPQKGSSKWKDYQVLLKTPSYVLTTLGMTAMTFAIGGIAFWLPYYVVEDRGQGPLSTVNMIFGGIIVLSGLSATFLGGIAGDRLRARYPGSYFLVSGVSMLLTFPSLVLVLKVDFPYAWGFIFIACFTLFFNTGPTNTILANVTHPSLRASAFALNILIIHALGDAVSPAIIGLIADYSSKGTAFFVTSILVAVGGVIWLCGIPYLQRDTALAPTRISSNA